MIPAVMVLAVVILAAAPVVGIWVGRRDQAANDARWAALQKEREAVDA